VSSWFGNALYAQQFFPGSAALILRFFSTLLDVAPGGLVEVDVGLAVVRIAST